jgi:protein-tyrosine phosphatase
MWRKVRSRAKCVPVVHLASNFQSLSKCIEADTLPKTDSRLSAPSGVVSGMSLLIDWRRADQPDDVVRPTVEALRQGGLVGLPTASGYLVAANATDAAAIDHLRVGPGGADFRPELIAAKPGDIERWAGSLPGDVSRILSRLWPGPLRLNVPPRKGNATESAIASAAHDDRLAFHLPAHSAVEAVLATTDFPVLARALDNPPGSQATAEQLASAWGDGLALVVDAGPIEVQAVTALSVDRDGWRIEEEGSLSSSAIAVAAARWIVFVCTGNTCRSPMTEALCKSLLGQRLGCTAEELPSRGWCILSAGVAAYPGDGPTPEAVAALDELGVDVSAHRSQPLSPALAAHADHLIAMTRGHLLAVLTRFPVIGGSMRLLGGAEGDLDDPIGGGPDVYAACAQTILHHLDRMLTELICR